MHYLSKNKTNQSEAISILGSYPTKTDIQAELKSDVKNGYNSYSFAIPAVLKQEGYTTSYFHNNVSDFYNRIDTHKGLGFDNLYFWNNLTTNMSDCQNDSSKIYVFTVDSPLSVRLCALGLGFFKCYINSKQN